MDGFYNLMVIFNSSHGDGEAKHLSSLSVLHIKARFCTLCRNKILKIMIAEGIVASKQNSIICNFLAFAVHIICSYCVTIRLH